MTPLALLLVGSAAVLHAAWNLLLKQAGEKQIFAWWAILTCSVAFCPLLLVGPPLPGRAWSYALASAAVEAAYFLTLAHAYRVADFSFVYPLARGTAPLLLAVWAWSVLGERPTRAGGLGLGLVALGVAFVASGGRQGRRPGDMPRTAALAGALAVALTISVYSIIDAAAVRFAPAAPYAASVTGLTALLMTPLVLKRHGAAVLLAEWRVHWPRLILAGLLMFLSYVLVLRAFAIAPVSYAGAVRETSVVLAAAAGWLWLGEPFGVRRLAGRSHRARHRAPIRRRLKRATAAAGLARLRSIL